MSSNVKTKTNDSLIFYLLRGIIVSIIISFVLIILFAFSLKWFDASDSQISVIALIIKAISIFLGALLFVHGNRGLLKGVSFGFVYILFAYIIFSILSGNFAINNNLFLDIIFSILSGGIAGIIKTNNEK